MKRRKVEKGDVVNFQMRKKKERIGRGGERGVRKFRKGGYEREMTNRRGNRKRRDR